MLPIFHTVDVPLSSRATHRDTIYKGLLSFTHLLFDNEVIGKVTMSTHSGDRTPFHQNNWCSHFDCEPNIVFINPYHTMTRTNLFKTHIGACANAPPRCKSWSHLSLGSQRCRSTSCACEEFYVCMLIACCNPLSVGGDDTGHGDWPKKELHQSADFTKTEVTHFSTRVKERSMNQEWRVLNVRNSTPDDGMNIDYWFHFERPYLAWIVLCYCDRCFSLLAHPFRSVELGYITETSSYILHTMHCHFDSMSIYINMTWHDMAIKQFRSWPVTFLQSFVHVVWHHHPPALTWLLDWHQKASLKNNSSQITSLQSQLGATAESQETLGNKKELRED